MDDIKQIGFEEVQVRFAPQVGARPTNWIAWNETNYQANWNFIVNTRAQVESALAGTSIRRVYDLGQELGGIADGQAITYQKRLWSDYHTLHSSDSYGFSIAYDTATGRTRLKNMVEYLKPTGAGLPPEYGIDMYGDQNTKLQEVAAD